MNAKGGVVRVVLEKLKVMVLIYIPRNYFQMGCR